MSPDKVHSVKLSFSGKQLEISSNSPDQGEAQDLLEADYEGPALKIGFNGRYLQDAVAGISEEKVVLQIKDEVSQVILRPEKDAILPGDRDADEDLLKDEFNKSFRIYIDHSRGACAPRFSFRFPKRNSIIP